MKNKINNYKDLIIWQKSIDLAVNIFNISRSFSKEELYGIVSQLRRVAYSIPSNIAEGYCRGRKLELKQFLKFAYASAAELETRLIICYRIKFLSLKKF